MQSLWLIVVVFFLILLIIPIFIKIYISFDAFNNAGAISLYLFFIKIFAYKLKVYKSGLMFYTSKNKMDVPLQISSGKIRFLEQLLIQLKQKVILKRIDLFSNIGINDAKNSAILAGFIQIVISTIFAKIKTQKKSAKLKHINNISYNQNRFTIALSGRLFITIFDVIYSSIISLLIVRRSEKYKSA